ncbi:hypothetical protein BpHYR1_042730 [Brachionus plicatilis]|uniref:Uncharacterized protein n=1 Tax=Brachionus plicatilis TaxID=10195 RepID=A0A3M7QXD2_BRAPC|nr:hypothetical protein BpHYR1_042730 [Brachionus plicatilis]
MLNPKIFSKISLQNTLQFYAFCTPLKSILINYASVKYFGVKNYLLLKNRLKRDKNPIFEVLNKIKCRFIFIKTSDNKNSIFKKKLKASNSHIGSRKLNQNNIKFLFLFQIFL